jgi:hypothetical protein
MKLLVWMLFGVTIALMPFYTRAIINHDRGQPVTLAEILGDGELLVVSVVINAAAIGELMSKGEIPEHFKLAKVAVIGVSLALLCVMSTWFADVSSIHAGGAKLPDNHNMARESLAFFFATLVVSASSLALSEVEA